MKYHILALVLLSGCAVHQQERWHRPLSLAEQAPDPPPTRVETPSVPKPEPTPSPPLCVGPAEERIDKLTAELAEAKEAREAWTKTHCTAAIGRHVWYDGRGFKHENGSTPMWTCDGQLVDTLVSSKEIKLSWLITVENDVRRHCH